jgi:hypothetical protein
MISQDLNKIIIINLLKEQKNFIIYIKVYMMMDIYTKQLKLKNDILYYIIFY